MHARYEDRRAEQVGIRLYSFFTSRTSWDHCLYKPTDAWNSWAKCCYPMGYSVQPIYFWCSVFRGLALDNGPSPFISILLALKHQVPPNPPMSPRNAADAPTTLSNPARRHCCLMQIHDAAIPVLELISWPSNDVGQFGNSSETRE
jgi:hypothetical protein